MNILYGLCRKMYYQLLHRFGLGLSYDIITSDTYSFIEGDIVKVHDASSVGSNYLVVAKGVNTIVIRPLNKFGIFLNNAFSRHNL